jgi:putative transposase
VPRKSRADTLANVIHITARGNRGDVIFFDIDDRLLFLRLFERVARRHCWTCAGYCLMSNHFHLVLEAPDCLSRGMQWLNGTYAHAFNEIHGLRGHLFGGRFKSEPVESEGHLLELCRYVVLNPIRARICRDPSQWRWSSYRACLGRADAPAWLDVGRVLDLFGTDRVAAARRFELFVREGR